MENLNIAVFRFPITDFFNMSRLLFFGKDAPIVSGAAENNCVKKGQLSIDSSVHNLVCLFPLLVCLSPK